MRAICVLLISACLGIPANSFADTVVGFDGGDNGGFSGNAFFEATGGNPGGNAHHFLQAFFPTLRTGALGEPANNDFLGDFSAFDEVIFGLDLRTESLTSTTGNPIAREIGIMLIDRDIQGPNGSSGVYTTLGVMNGFATPTWETLSVTIDDPTSTTLPSGWIGFGDEDPNSFEPILPAGAAFATVLAGVDEFRITGAVPRFFFGFANFDVRIDNVRVSTTAIPEPSAGMLLGLVAIGIGAARRRARSA